MLLTDDTCEQVLGFIVADLASWKNVRVVSQQFLAIAHSPASWMGASINISACEMASKHNLDQILKLAASWSLAKSVSLEAHSNRNALKLELQKICPTLDVSTAADGPYLLFVMGCRFGVGEVLGLHFFEPRYRWMCERVFANQRPHMFAFVTRGGARPGSRGVLCEISRFRRNSDGTFDVHITARTSFTLLEVWHEEVPNQPRAPPLAVGLLDLDGPAGKGSATPGVSFGEYIRRSGETLTNEGSAPRRRVKGFGRAIRKVAARLCCCCLPARQ